MIVAVVAYHTHNWWKKKQARRASKIAARLGLVAHPHRPYPESCSADSV